MAVPIAAILQQAAGTTASAVSQYLNGKAQKAYYGALQDTYNTNAELNDIQTARQSAYINEAAASQVHLMRGEREDVQSSARAAMAAQGMDLSSGSAQAVLLASERAAQEDEDLVRYQAELAAFENNKQGALASASLRSQAKVAGLMGRAAAKQGRLGAWGSILTGAAQTGGTIFDSIQDERNRQEELKAKYGYSK